MNTLKLFASTALSIPPAMAWYLSDLGEFRGRQELYTHQLPQRLKALRLGLTRQTIGENSIEVSIRSL